ncbi:hypothetical protein KKF61_05925 [Patescibacteria group bacterium]|nr:hypothetical protein [Patescibacteria group bacterium]MBU0964602.1 hypothetical protein [Patescibacteria group bacterium]
MSKLNWDFRQKRISKKIQNEPKYRNPLYTKNSWQSFVIARFSIFSWLVILVLLVFFYIIFYSPLFQITKITIAGISAKESKVLDEKFVRWQLQQNKWKIFKQSNILIFSKDWLRENIESKYNPEFVDINKSIPHTLSITIKEKNPVFIWITDNSYYYLEETGIISEKIDNPENLPAMPALYDGSNTPVKPGDQVLATERMDVLNNFVNRLNALPEVTVIGYTIPHILGARINVQTEAGYDIYFDLSRDLDSQINKLTATLNELNPEEIPREYIDVRIGDRVYTK